MGILKRLDLALFPGWKTVYSKTDRFQVKHPVTKQFFWEEARYKIKYSKKLNKYKLVMSGYFPEERKIFQQTLLVYQNLLSYATLEKKKEKIYKD
jgi:hypothetical protein